jgi:hypothetical protein
VMDVQRGIVERFAGDPEYLPRLRGAIEVAHRGRYLDRQARLSIRVARAPWPGSAAPR